MAHMSDDELEPLITECPGCQTRFRVAETQLQRAGGKVRCGACLTVFHGVDHLTFESAQTYASEEHAQRALDALLDELADPAAARGADREPAAGPGQEAPPKLDPGEDAAGAPGVQKPTAAPARTPPAPPLRREPPKGPIFSGFEEPEGNDAGRTGPAYVFQVLEEPESGRGGAERADTDDTATGPAPEDAAAEDAGSLSSGAPERQTAADSTASDAKASVAPVTDEKPAEPAGPAASEPAGEPGERETGPAIVFGEIRRRRPLVWLGIVAGLVLLVAQVLWYQFDDWSKDPQWRGVYVTLCGMVGCELPPLRDRSLLTTRNLAVRSHPDIDGRLLVNAVIVNEAEFAQPFPALELRFTTVRGTLVAGRRFEPEEYLAGDASDMSLIPPRTPVQVELTIDDPGPEAVNYFLRFR